MGQTVKLTVRLPRRLHERLKRKAQQSHRSLNSLIVESLSGRRLAGEADTEHEAVRRVLVQSGLWAPHGAEWSDLVSGTQDIADDELQESLEDLQPLSDVVIEGRGPR